MPHSLGHAGVSVVAEPLGSERSALVVALHDRSTLAALRNASAHLAGSVPTSAAELRAGHWWWCQATLQPCGLPSRAERSNALAQVSTTFFGARSRRNGRDIQAYLQL